VSIVMKFGMRLRLDRYWERKKKFLQIGRQVLSASTGEVLKNAFFASLISRDLPYGFL
jgi:hypothetical protein